MKFVKYENYWYEYDESTPINDARIWNMYGGCSSCNDISNCEMVEAEDFNFLDWSGTSLYNDEFLTGWLDKEGNFYGCSPKHHKEQAKLVHNSSEEDLERNLFIKIAYLDRLQKELVAMVSHQDGKKNPISKMQLDFLKKHPIQNFDEIEYIYRMQLKKLAEQKQKEFENSENQPGM